MRRPQTHWFGLLLTLLWLAGCSSQPLTPPLDQPWSDYRSHLQTLNQWEITGKLGLRSPTQNGSANLNWLQQPDRYRILLTGPLGQGAVQIQGGLHQVTLHHEQGVFSAASPEQLLEQQLGWSLPLSNLYYWVRGLPAPGAPADSQLNAAGQLTRLQQAGWSIHYSRYNRFGNYYLPGRIRISDDRHQLTLVIKDWGL